MQTTTNYALKKPDGTDLVKRSDFNTNFDIIDSQMAATNASLSDMDYQTAGGTATAITLTTQTLRNGYAKNFIAKFDNGGVATKINTIPVYKPGTTQAPTIKANKPYTMIYNEASTCFFLKASATGTALASQVLKDVPFSTEVDTDLVGTMPNNGALGTVLAINGAYTIPAGYTTGGTVTQSITTKGTTTYNPSTVAQTIAGGQYLSGTQTIAATTGTATTGKVLSGYTFNSANGIGLVGTAFVNDYCIIGTKIAGGSGYHYYSYSFSIMFVVLINSSTNAFIALAALGYSSNASMVTVDYGGTGGATRAVVNASAISTGINAKIYIWG